MLKSMVPWLASTLLITVLAAPADAHLVTEKRVALVIGVGDYRDSSLGKLVHPKPDALAVSQALHDLGFEVVTKLNVTKQDLQNLFDGFANDRQRASAVLVYFSGEGVQIGGKNFLLPADANFTTPETLRNSAVPLEELFARAARVAPNRIVLLDACRDDLAGRAAGMHKDPALPLASGLGRVGRADGTIYAFSAAPGATAQDGHGDHSPFAQALLAHLGEKGLEFSSVMKLVQMEVYDQTPQHQLPYVEDALPALIFAAPQNDSNPLSERDRLLLAMAKIAPNIRTQVERVAAAEDVPLAPLYGTLFASNMLSSDDDNERQRLLEQAADDYTKVRANLQTLASTDPEVGRLRAQAQHDLSIGAFESARAALTRAIAVDYKAGRTLETRLNERKLSEAASYAARASVVSAELERRAASRDFAAAAELAGNTKSLAWQYQVEQAGKLRDLGDDSGDDGALLEAIETYEKALKLAPRNERPLDWAKTQNELGAALAILGARERGTARLQAAVAVQRQALEEFTRQRAPLDWAKTQAGLGYALRLVGERAAGTGHLPQAVTAYRAALEEQTRARNPLEWAKTEAGLAVVLFKLGSREIDTAHLQQAVATGREAFQEPALAGEPLERAKVQQSLAGSLIAMASRRDDRAGVLEAVSVFREVLKQQPPETAPLAWASAKRGLAEALTTQGFYESGTAHFEEAATSEREALSALSRDRVPLPWAVAQVSLARTLTLWGARETGATRLEEAVFAAREALKELTREQDPFDWATAQFNLGGALRTLAQRESGTARLEEAVAAYRKALEVETHEHMPIQWAATQNDFGLALLALGKRETGTAHLEEAVAAFDGARREHIRDHMPVRVARNTGNMGFAMIALAQRRNDSAMAADALTQLESAVKLAREAGEEEMAAHFDSELAKARAPSQQSSAR
jgi:uncharacterized caspase-like protein